jgi:hypothetical protein
MVFVDFVLATAGEAVDGIGIVVMGAVDVVAADVAGTGGTTGATLSAANAEPVARMAARAAIFRRLIFMTTSFANNRSTIGESQGLDRQQGQAITLCPLVFAESVQVGLFRKSAGNQEIPAFL